MFMQTITRLISASEVGLLTQGPKVLENIATRNSYGASIASRAQALFSTSTPVAATGAASSDET